MMHNETFETTEKRSSDSRKLAHHREEHKLSSYLSRASTVANTISHKGDFTTSTSESDIPSSCTCWNSSTSVQPRERFKSNKGSRLHASSSGTNLQDFVAAAFAHKCSCQMQSSAIAVTSSHAPVSASKKNVIWKDSNTEIECNAENSINSCSACVNMSNEEELNSESVAIKCEACFSRNQVVNVVEYSDGTCADEPNKDRSFATKVCSSTNELPCESAGKSLGLLSSSNTPAWPTPIASSAESIEVSKSRNGDDDSLTKQHLNTNDNRLSTKDNNNATPISGRAPLSPNAYTLDFLHSVGVQIAGVSNQASLDTPLGRENKNNLSVGVDQMSGNSIHRASQSCKSLPQRQHRNIVGAGNGANNYNYQHQQQHHNHHPSQLTIASFLQKDLFSGRNAAGKMLGGSRNIARDASVAQNEQYNNVQQQHYNRHHHHARYNTNYFHQQPQANSTHSCSFPNSAGLSVSVDINNHQASLNGDAQTIAQGYINYYNETSNGSQMMDFRPLKQQPSVYGSYHGNKCEAFQNSIPNKKVSHSSSSISSCSSSSKSSNSSISSQQKHPQTQQTKHRQQKSSTTVHSAIETLPSKFSNHNSNHRQGHHRTALYHGNNYHSHHNHHGHQHHSLPNTPTTPQHQNYYNLTYVSTDGSAVNTNNSNNSMSRASRSAAQSSAPTSIASKTLVQKPLELVNCPAPMLSTSPHAGNPLTYSRYSNYSPQQFDQAQIQKFENKQYMTQLTHIVAATSPPPANLATQQLPIRPHSIICCSQLDEATTAAAAVAAKSVVLVGNEEEEGTSSTPSKDVVTPQPAYQDSQLGYPAEYPSSAAHLIPPSDYAYAPTVSAQSFSGNIDSSGNAQLQQQQYQQQHVLNQEELNYNAVSSNASGSDMPQVNGNSRVIPTLNLSNTLTPDKGGDSSRNVYGEDVHKLQQSQNVYHTHSQPSFEHLGVILANSNGHDTSCGYWSPTHPCSVMYKPLPSSCVSSTSSVSPCLTDKSDESNSHSLNPTAGDSSPSLFLSDHTVESLFSSSLGGRSSINSSSSNTSVSTAPEACSFVRPLALNIKSGSTQLLIPQQQRLIAQRQLQTKTSSPTLLNCTTSALSNSYRVRSSVRRNQQHQPLLPSSSHLGGGVNNVYEQQFAHIFPPHQSLPPLPHNLLYNNPQAHNLRSINNASMHDFFTHTPPDRFLARAHLIEAKETPPYLLNNSKWDNLSRDIWRKFMCSQQTEETFKQKMRLWRYLYLFIKNAYPRYGLYLVGSTISGFGSDTSDVDMCLVSRSASSIDPRMEALYNLTILRDCLSKSGEFEHFNLIEAKVPILRFRERVHQLEVDLNFNNCVGIKNTHLLYCYSQLDWRLRPLVLVTKLWAQHHDINNAKNMTISSYSLVLMVIHFLQNGVDPPVLPCLHDMFPEKFPLLRSNDFGYVDMNETIGPFESKNDKTIGELFLKFLEYYSCFDYTQYAISVRTGGTLPISVCRIAKAIKNDPHQWKELCIEEPFDLTNTARSVYDYETFERVKGVFYSSWRMLQETLDLNSVFATTVEMSVLIKSKIPVRIETDENRLAYDTGVLQSSMGQTTACEEMKSKEAEYVPSTYTDNAFGRLSREAETSSFAIASSCIAKRVGGSDSISTAITT